jgi:hypothetical protein
MNAGFGRCRAGVVPLAVVLLLAGAQPALAQACTGDCNGDGAVTVDEIVTGVNIALDTVGIASCATFDADGSTTVTVDEIITAVNLALGGCSVTVTSTETPTETLRNRRPLHRRRLHSPSDVMMGMVAVVRCL